MLAKNCMLPDVSQKLHVTRVVHIFQVERHKPQASSLLSLAKEPMLAELLHPSRVVHIFHTLQRHLRSGGHRAKDHETKTAKHARCARQEAKR